YAALELADQVTTIAPGKEYVTREYTKSLERAGVPLAALNSARQHPGLLNDKEIRKLQADYAAELVRLAEMPSRQETERFIIADRALAEYDRLIQQWETLGPAASDELLRIRMDRLQALQIRMRMSEVVSEYESLTAQGTKVPRYVLNDVANAYFYLREP